MTGKTKELSGNRRETRSSMSNKFRPFHEDADRNLVGTPILEPFDLIDGATF